MINISNIRMLFLSIVFSFSFMHINAQENEEALEEVVVTGSYIKGSATDGSSPVQIIGRETIEDLGATTIADITRNISVNNGSENNPDSFQSGSTQGWSNVNLRGLGLSSTLVLVDGKRNTVAAATANDGSVFVDTNSIPVIALERVEVLTEGAASVYGSDAVAGVVNYILRRDFTGAEVVVSQQEADLGSQTDNRAGFIVGTEIGNNNFVLAYSKLDRSPIPGTAISQYNQFGSSGFGNSFLVFPPAALADLTPAQLFTTVASGPYAGTYNVLENVPDANCVANKGNLIPMPAPNAVLSGGQRCGFFFGDRFNIINDENHTSLYSSMKTTMQNGVEFEMDYMQTTIAVHDNPQSPSYPALSYLATSNLIMPGNGGSPFSYPIMWVGRALGSAFPSPLAPRDYDNDRFSVGLSGSLNNGFDWEVSYTDSNQSSYYFQPDTSTSKFKKAIEGTGGAAGNLTWNLFDPTANSAELISYISSGEERWTEAGLSVIDIILTGTTKNGIDIATGFQHRAENFEIQRNDASKAVFGADGSITQQSDLIFLGGGQENDSSRNTKAIFVEAAKDMNDKLQLKGAMRYEILKSESTFNPKVSMRYQMSDNLVLRGSYSTSFREASLVQLNSDLVALEQLQDYNTDGTTRGSVAFIRAAKASNKTLTPEESDNINIGAVWKPNSQTSLTVDYWNIEYTNVITMENTQAKLIADPDGPDVVRLNGTLVGITASYFNASEINASGMDVQAEYKFDTSLGQASVAYDMAHIMEYEIPVAGVMKDVVGSFNHDNFARSMPETKSVISASLRNGDHKISAYYRMISDYENGRTIPASAVAAGFSNTIDEFNTLDLKYSYSFSVNNNDGTLSVGVNNATDEVAPGAYDLSNFSYDSRQHDPRGKIVNVGLKISF